ncbi:MAG TPA: hypothetical protein VI911_04825 [Patescibacteria group bacterium]|nr:hypothetical protein [Patescibacteria group bacterium]
MTNYYFKHRHREKKSYFSGEAIKIDQLPKPTPLEILAKRPDLNSEPEQDFSGYKIWWETGHI